MIILKEFTLNRGALILLDKINLTIKNRARIGLVGQNGCGKSSLFSAIKGELLPSHGDLDMSDNLLISAIDQEVLASDESALDFVIAGDKEVATANAELQLAEKAEDFDKVVALHGKLAELDGYSVLARAAKIIKGLGFSDEEQQRPYASFSGGYRMRLNLAKCLMAPSDLLLLDEPTNHLDMPALLWLEQWLKTYRGMVLIISHDRDFLDNTVESIIHIENKSAKAYQGNYSSFERQRAEFIVNNNANANKQKKAIAHLQSFVDRFRYKQSKARQAQSRLKMIDKMKQLTPIYDSLPFTFEFFEPTKAANPIVKFNRVTVGYNDKPIIERLSFSLRANQSIGILGRNGAGKSTLLNTIVGNLKPLKNDVEIVAGINIGYFAQHQIDALPINESAFDMFQEKNRSSGTQVIRNYLGRFNFHGDKIFDEIKTFSGGEKARLALADIIWQRPNLLILDEPTNHFDLEMQDALTVALQNYQGTLILVSHDRRLLKSCVTDLWLIDEGEMIEFDGSIEDYLEFIA